jgi:hypothetical protein
MVVARPSVEGPDWAALVARTEQNVATLQRNHWDFKALPDAFPNRSAADVVAKEVVHVFDGKTMTRHGRLIMGARTGKVFNLMGPIPPDSQLRVTSHTTRELLKAVHHQTGTQGLEELAEYRQLGEVQDVEFFNYEMFYTIPQLVFWLLVRDAGSYPSSLEIVVRHMAAGNIVQNMMYSPSHPARDGDPVYVRADGLTVSFPSTVVEWMDKPIYGGLVKDTTHVEHLLTLDKTDVSHPHLPLVGEGKVQLDGRPFHVRRFAGVTPKDGVRGPGVQAENAEDRY